MRACCTKLKRCHLPHQYSGHAGLVLRTMSGGCLVWDAMITLRGDVLLKPLVASECSGRLRRGALLSKPGGATAAWGLSESRGSNPGGARPAGFAWRRAACTWDPLISKVGLCLLYASQKCDQEAGTMKLQGSNHCFSDFARQTDALTSHSFAVLYILNAQVR